MGPSDQYDLCCKLTKSTFNLQVLSPLPICSMSGIFTNIYQTIQSKCRQIKDTWGIWDRYILLHLQKFPIHPTAHLPKKPLQNKKNKRNLQNLKRCHVCTKTLPRPKKKSPGENYFPTTKNGRKKTKKTEQNPWRREISILKKITHRWEVSRLAMHPAFQWIVDFQCPPIRSSDPLR